MFLLRIPQNPCKKQPLPSPKKKKKKRKLPDNVAAAIGVFCMARNITNAGTM
jgi:hypothetical protein